MPIGICFSNIPLVFRKQRAEAGPGRSGLRPHLRQAGDGQTPGGQDQPQEERQHPAGGEK